MTSVVASALACIASAVPMGAPASSPGVNVLDERPIQSVLDELVNGIMSAAESPEVAVGVVPFGTANDFATGCGIPIGDPLAALRLASEGDPKPIDVRKVNDHYFVNVDSGGFGARVTAETPAGLKISGGAAYSLMGLVTAAKMTPYRGRLVAPDGEEPGAMILMAAGIPFARQRVGSAPAPRCALLDLRGHIDVSVRQLLGLARPAPRGVAVESLLRAIRDTLSGIITAPHLPVARDRTSGARKNRPKSASSTQHLPGLAETRHSKTCTLAARIGWTHVSCS